MPQFEGEVSLDGKNYKIKGEFNFMGDKPLENLPSPVQISPSATQVIGKQKLVSAQSEDEVPTAAFQTSLDNIGNISRRIGKLRITIPESQKREL